MTPLPTRCPACGAGRFVLRHTPRQLQREIDLRSRIVYRHFDHKPEPAELMDLTEFMHGGPGEILACAACGLLFRREPHPADYAADHYDANLLRHLYPRYRDGFLAKAPLYRQILRPHAEVVELGSHLGAFLEVAETWNWRPIGLDIGRDTSAFARANGLTVRRSTLDDYSARAEALFIWNCFEQLDDPAAVLRGAHRILQRHGLLTIRVPNAAFYERWHEDLNRRTARSALARNNLLAFPYLYGYRLPLLSTLLANHGFETIEAHPSTLLTLPFPESDPPSTATRLAQDHPATAPWIELIARRRE